MNTSQDFLSHELLESIILHRIGALLALCFLALKVLCHPVTGGVYILGC